MKEIKNEINKEETEVKSVKEYDGYEDVREPLIDGTYVTQKRKAFLSLAEQRKFFGSNNPELYFRDGKIPVAIPKALGTLIEDPERYEHQVFMDAFRNYDDLLLFKHDLVNIYTILVPKKYTELELNDTGEFRDRLVRYDTRSIAFTGKGNLPSSFEKDYFNKIANNIKTHFDKAIKVHAKLQ